MKKNNNIFWLSKHLFFSTAFWMMACFMLSQCTPKSQQASNASESIRTLIVGGGASHDFDKWYKEADARTLREDGLATVRYTDNTDSIVHYLPDIDVLYLTNNQPISDPKTRQAIFDFADAGKGLVLGHAALWYNWEDWPEYNQLMVSGGSSGHDKYGSFDVNITNTNHPVTQGVDQKFTLKDELYYFKVDESGPGIEVLATASTEGSEIFPSVFVINHPNARIVGIALGHDGESHDLKAYKTILRNAVKWAANE
ncbi:MAG: ThuA domain-containing protein [Anditalea sp.]